MHELDGIAPNRSSALRTLAVPSPSASDGRFSTSSDVFSEWEAFAEWAAQVDGLEWRPLPDGSVRR